MNEYAINNKIKSTTFLIERDELILPSSLEEAISSLTTAAIAKEKKSIITATKSDYEIEMAKVKENLQAFFDKDIIDRCHKEILSKSYFIVSAAATNVYFSSFFGNQIPDCIYIPKQLDTISHIFIGHEITHVLKEGKNKQEWIYLFLYSEVIPMLYELIQAEKSDQKTNIIKWRLNKLLEMYQNAYNPDVLNTLDKERLRLYQLPENIYFISFYYTLILYSLYKEVPTTILALINKVLKKQITTKELLQDLGLLNTIEDTKFQEEYKKLVLTHH